MRRASSLSLLPRRADADRLVQPAVGDDLGCGARPAAGGQISTPVVTCSVPAETQHAAGFIRDRTKLRRRRAAPGGAGERLALSPQTRISPLWRFFASGRPRLRCASVASSSARARCSPWRASGCLKVLPQSLLLAPVSPEAPPPPKSLPRRVAPAAAAVAAPTALMPLPPPPPQMVGGHAVIGAARRRWRAARIARHRAPSTSAPPAPAPDGSPHSRSATQPMPPAAAAVPSEPGFRRPEDAGQRCADHAARQQNKIARDPAG